LNSQIQVGISLINQWTDNPIQADFDYVSFDSCAPVTLRSYLPITYMDYYPSLMMPILAMAFYPPSSGNPAYLDEIETGISSRLITTMQSYVQQMIDEGVPFVSEATRYHGYKDSTSRNYLQYRMYGKIEYNYAIPRGYQTGTSSYMWDLAAILRNINICNYIDGAGVKEIWIYGYETAVMHPSESKMSSRYGDISNSKHDEELPEIYRLPRCTNSYTVYSFNYGREIETNIENRMHQIDRVMMYIDYNTYMKDYSEDVTPGLVHSYPSSCGCTHFTPNWVSYATDEYIYNLSNYHLSNCETWHPNDSLTTYINLNCTQWGCTKLGFFRWYMQNLPGKNNGISYNGKMMRNWWDAIYDFNAYIDAGKSFYLP
jgi:hypothetical protein